MKVREIRRHGHREESAAVTAASDAGGGRVGLVMWSLSRFIIFMVRIGRGCRRWFRIFGSCGGGGGLLLR